MIRFRELKVRSKLACTFVAVVLPLLAAEILAVAAMRGSLREAAELELTNVVNHLYRLCDVLDRDRRDPVASDAPARSRPTPDQVAFVRAVLDDVRVGSTGYAYCMEASGTLVIHPTKEGQNILGSRDSKGLPFIRTMRDLAVRLGPGEVGTIRYPWTNVEVGETRARMKLLKFRYFREWNWLIAAGSYEEEIFAAVGRLGRYAGPLVFVSIALVVALSLVMNRVITRPLVHVSDVAGRMAAGDLRQRVKLVGTGDEFAALGCSFNAMADEIREKTNGMERLIDDRTEALRESRERYRSLVESTVDGIVTTDPSGAITFVNRGMEAMLGHTREAMLGREVWQYYTGGTDEARALMTQLRERGSITNHEMVLIGKHRTVPIRTSATLLRDEAGGETGTLGIFSDITAEKRLEADLRQTQAHLVQTTKLRALGDLVSGVAHEINNPLMASTTMLHVMEQADCPDGCPNRKRMGVVRRCNDRIARIVNHLRDFSRQADLVLEKLDINEPIENALLLTGQQLLNMGMEIRKELASDRIEVVGDAHRLEQAFLDIIANARDAMAGIEGPRVLTLRSFRSELAGRPWAAVEITDTGPGIPGDIREKIFEPFFTTKEVGKGTGLGLSITYGIIEEHGGRIELDTPRPRGTTFRILLPAPNQAVEERDRHA